MGEIINLNNEDVQKNNVMQELTDVFGEFELEKDIDVISKKTIAMPMAEVATLGAGVSSLLPCFRTITQTISIDGSGLYRPTNLPFGEVLKQAKDGTYWGSSKGSSKMIKWEAAGDVSGEATSFAAINPSVMLIAVALFTIEKEFSKIEEMEQQIIEFLRFEKESKIEADVEMLYSIAKKFKDNWDNQLFMNSNHKLIVDIQRSARANIIFYKREIDKILEEKNYIPRQQRIKTISAELVRKFKYFRLCLYIFSMSSLFEVMLSGNFKDEYISKIKDEINVLSIDYREIFGKCSLYLEELSDKSIETNALKGVGTVSNIAGKVIENIPVVSRGPVDEFLQESGEKLKDVADAMESNLVKDFSKISNPNINVFIDKLENIKLIFNNTKDVYFDKNNVYLVMDA